MKTKPFIIAILLALLIGACTNQENDLGENMGTLGTQKSHPIRSYAEALDVALSALNSIDGSSTTRSSIVREIDLGKTQICRQDPLTRSLNSCINDTLLYVFNFKNDNGFAVISASKKTMPLLAITERGNYDSSESSGIGGFDVFMEMAENYVMRSYDEEPDTSEVEVYEEYEYHHQYTGPFVTVQWGQTFPEGELCPNGISGCAITAMAQLMSYYERPQVITLTYPGSGGYSEYLPWTQMKAHTGGHSLENCTSDMQSIHATISRLTRQLGYLAASTYNTNSTSTSDSGMISCLQSCGYTYTYNEFLSISGIKAQLNQERPVLAIASTYTQNGSVGHAWNIDGLDNMSYFVNWYAESADGTRYLIESDGPYYEDMFHINWGWNGANNGYFVCGVFNAPAVQFPDTNNNGADYNFSYNFRSIYVSNNN